MNTPDELQATLEGWDGAGDPPKLSDVEASAGFQSLSPGGRVKALNQAQRNWADRLRTDDATNYGDYVRDLETDFDKARRSTFEQSLADDLRAGKLQEREAQELIKRGYAGLGDTPAGKYVQERYGDEAELTGPWVTQKQQIPGGFAYTRTAAKPREDGTNPVEVSWTINGKKGQLRGVEDVDTGGVLPAAEKAAESLDQTYNTGKAFKNVIAAQRKKDPKVFASETAARIFGEKAKQSPEISDQVGQGFWEGAPGQATKEFLKLGASATYGVPALFGSREASDAYQQATKELETDFEGQSRLAYRGGFWDKIAMGITGEVVPMALSMGASAAAGVARRGATGLTESATEKFLKSAGGETLEAATPLLRAANGGLGKFIGTAKLKGDLAQNLADRVTNAISFLPSSMRSGLENMATTYGKADEYRASAEQARKAGDQETARKAEVKAAELEDNATMNMWAGTAMETLSENMWLNEMLVTRSGRKFGDVAAGVLERRLGGAGKAAALKQRAKDAITTTLVSGGQEGLEEVAAGVGGRAWMNAFAEQNAPLLEGVPEEFTSGAIMGAVMGGAKELAAEGKPEMLKELMQRGLDGDPEASKAWERIKGKAAETPAVSEPATPPVSETPVATAAVQTTAAALQTDPLTEQTGKALEAIVADDLSPGDSADALPPQEQLSNEPAPGGAPGELSPAAPAPVDAITAPATSEPVRPLASQDEAASGLHDLQTEGTNPGVTDGTPAVDPAGEPFPTTPEPQPAEADAASILPDEENQNQGRRQEVLTPEVSSPEGEGADWTESTTTLPVRDDMGDVVSQREVPGWRTTDTQGGEAWGYMDGDTAHIVGINSQPSEKRRTSEEGKRRGYLRSVIQGLRERGAKSLSVAMQSQDSRKALARLVETGELTNPRNLAGTSMDEHPTKFDIAHKQPTNENLQTPAQEAERIQESLPSREPGGVEGAEPATGEGAVSGVSSSQKIVAPIEDAATGVEKDSTVRTTYELTPYQKEAIAKGTPHPSDPAFVDYDDNYVLNPFAMPPGAVPDDNPDAEGAGYKIQKPDGTWKMVFMDLDGSIKEGFTEAPIIQPTNENLQTPAQETERIQESLPPREPGAVEGAEPATGEGAVSGVDDAAYQGLPFRNRLKNTVGEAKDSKAADKWLLEQGVPNWQVNPASGDAGMGNITLNEGREVSSDRIGKLKTVGADSRLVFQLPSGDLVTWMNETGRFHRVERGDVDNIREVPSETAEKPAEQMTPDEVWADEQETMGKMARREDAKMVHEMDINTALGARKPVSAAAVKAYKIPLPEGYQKQGELYVYAPTTNSSQTGSSPVVEQESGAEARALTKESLKETFDLTDEQAGVAEILAKAMGITEGTRVKKGGRPGAGARSQYAGEKANVPQFMRDSLETAKAMAAAGKTSEEIRAITGWFPGKYDGKMRWEVPDEGARLLDIKDTSSTQKELDDAREHFERIRAKKEGFTPEFTAAQLRVGNLESKLKREKTSSRFSTLGESLHHPALFEAYPSLRNVKVEFLPLSDRGGDWNVTTNTIRVNSNMVPSNVLSLIQHEVQHAVQDLEGFAKGSAPSQFSDYTEQAATRRTYYTNEIDALSDALILKGYIEKGESISEAKSSFRAEFGKPPKEEAGQHAKFMSRQEILDEVDRMAEKLNKATNTIKNGSQQAQYQKTAGEIEARDVQARQNFTPEQRAAIEPYSSENIAKEDAIVLFQDDKGSAEVTEAGKVLLRGLESPDITTALHEMAHAARMLGFPTLTPDEVSILEEWAGAKDGVWDEAADEKFARGWERYLAEGKAPTISMQALFNKLKQWFANIYGQIKNSAIDVDISAPVRALFDKLVTGPPVVVNETPVGDKQTPLSSTGEGQEEAEAAPPTEKKPTRQPIRDADREAVDEGATSTKNAVTDYQREQFDLPDFKGTDILSEHVHEAVLAEAIAIYRSTPNAADAIIARQQKNPSSLKPVETAILMMENLKAEKAMRSASAAAEKASASGDEVAVSDALEIYGQARERAVVLYDTEKMAGTAWGRDGRFRQRLLREDYTLVKMTSDKQTAANRGKKLEPEQQAEVDKQHSAISEAEKDLVAKAEEAAVARVEEIYTTIFRESAATRTAAAEAAKGGFSLLQWHTDRVNAARERMAKRAQQAHALGLLDPMVYLDAITILSDYIRKGIEKLVDWKQALRDEVGEEVAGHEDYLRAAAEDEVAAVDEAFATRPTKALTSEEQAKKEEAKAARKAARRKGQAEASIAVDAANAVAEPGTLPSRKVVRNFYGLEYAKGTKTSREATANVTKAIRDYTVGEGDAAVQPFSTLTEQQVQDIFTAYGDVIEPSKDPMMRKLSEWRQLELLYRKLEVVMAGSLPDPTGLRRSPLSPEAQAEARNLTRQINEIKKSNPALAQKQSPEQLAGAMDAVITRLTNEIADMEAKIEQFQAGDPAALDPVTKKPLNYNEKALELVKQRDSLREKIQQLKGKKPLSVEKRIEIANAALDQVVENLEREIETGVKTERAKTDPITSPELEEKRAYVATLRQELEDRKPRKSPIETRLAAAQKALDYHTGLLDGTITPKTNAPKTALSQAEEDLRLQVQAIQQVLAEEKKAKRPQTPAEEKERKQLIGAAERATKEFQRRIAAKDFGKKPGPKLGPVQASVAAAQEIRDAAKKAFEAARKLELGDNIKEQEKLEALERAEENYQRKLRDKRTPGDRPKAPEELGPDTEEQAAARAARDAAKKDYEDFLASKMDEITLRQDLSTARRQIALLTRKIEKGDYRKKTKREKGYTKELRELDAEIVKLKEKWHQDLYLDSQKHLSFDAKVKREIVKIFNTQRFIQLGADFGVVLRQAGTAISHPSAILKAFGPAWRASTSETQAIEEQRALENAADYKVWKSAGVEFTELGNMASQSKQEEAMLMGYVEKLPAFLGGSILRGSSRGQMIFINHVRLNLARIMGKSMSRFGTPTTNEMKVYSRLINAATGRSSVGKSEKFGMPLLNAVFLAYRWAKSRIQYSIAQPLWWPVIQEGTRRVGVRYFGSTDLEPKATFRSTVVVANEIARTLIGNAILTSVVMSAISLLEDDDEEKRKVETDPRSPRFLKMIVGKTEVDFTAGVAPAVHMLTKMVVKEKMSRGGKMSVLVDTDEEKVSYGGNDLGSELGRYFRSKLSPMVGGFWTWQTGKDPAGNRATLLPSEGDATGMLLPMVTPLIFQDIYKALRSNDVPEAAALGLLSFFGASMQTMEDKRREAVSSKTLNFLYDHELSLPQVDEYATVHTLRGGNAKLPINKLKLTEEHKAAIFKQTLQPVEDATDLARAAAKNLPEDKELREAKLHSIQNDYHRRVQQARKNAVNALIREGKIKEE